jgi:hypothetical protein
MGTRAFIEFPLYQENWDEAAVLLRPVWTEPLGSIFVYTQYDGRELPMDLHFAVNRWMEEQYAHMGNPLDERIANIEPEYIAAQLLRKVFDDVDTAVMRISRVQPQEGLHLIFDVKNQTVTYCGREEDDNHGVFPLPEWVQRSWAPDFYYDPEDLDNDQHTTLTPEEEAAMEIERARMAMIMADPQEDEPEDEDED